MNSRDAQRLDFAYGQLAATSHHKPYRSAFLHVARELGILDSDFDAWAADKQWWGDSSMMTREEAQYIFDRRRDARRCMMCGGPPNYPGADLCGAACCAEYEGDMAPAPLREDEK